MKAITHHRYGGPEVLGLENAPTPIPGEGEVRIRVHAAGLNAGDRHLMRADPFILRFMFGGLLRPKNTILGSAVAGTVETVGEGVTRFDVGDRVFGDLSESGFGAFAEFACAPEEFFAPIPEGTDFEQAAAVPVGALVALQALRGPGSIREGMRVLVNGASGGVGHFAVQIARSHGAEVTGVCGTRNVEMVRSLGASRVIDYSETDYTAMGETWDLILDTAAHHSFSDCKQALSPGGTYIMVGGPVSQMFKLMAIKGWLSRGGDRTFATILSRPNQDDMQVLSDLLAAGDIEPFIGRTYPLEALAEAFRDLEGRRVPGKLVIQM
jgi:NADPH:quinone reductase-like Zn-dependent oxidoreductase